MITTVYVLAPPHVALVIFKAQFIAVIAGKIKETVQAHRFTIGQGDHQGTALAIEARHIIRGKCHVHLAGYQYPGDGIQTSNINMAGILRQYFNKCCVHDPLPYT